MDTENQYDYRLSAIRLQNFMAFEDTGWIELRPITLLFGRNSSGKSAIIRALLLLKQSIEARDLRTPLLFNGRWVDLGSFYNAVHRHEADRNITFGFRLSRPPFEDPSQRREEEAEKDFEQRQTEYERRLNEYKNAGISQRWSLTGGPSVNVDDDRVDLELTFGQIDGSQTAILKRLAINGWRKRAASEPTDVLIFSCDRRDDGIWQPASQMPLDYEREEGEGEHRVTRQHPQFSAEFWPKSELDLSSGPIPKRLWLPDADPVKFLLSDRPPDWVVVDKALEFFHQRLVGLLTGMVYLPPLREEPRRYYRADHEWVRALMDLRGEMRRTINQWLQKASLNADLRTMLLDEREGVVAVYLGESVNGVDLRTNLRDVGSGVNQAVPVIVKSLQAKSKSLVIIEQPELHLHPEAQQTLAAMFLECIGAGAYLLVETHSEHIFFHVRRLLALPRETEGNQPRSLPRVDDFMLLFVNRADGKSTTRGVALGPDGKLIGAPPELRYFFGYNEEMRRQLDEDHRNRLKRGLHERFTGEELASLCFDMGINKEDALVGDTLQSKVEQLVLYCERRGDIPRLFRKCIDLRKDYDW